jgi:hypothetical protein
MSTRYEVQHYTLCDGWVNTWSDDTESPITFASINEAVDELDEYLDDTQEAFDCGDLDSPYERSEFRIAEVV